MRLEFDAESGALYIAVCEGRVEQTFDLAEPGLGASMDVDGEGNVLGLRFSQQKSTPSALRALAAFLSYRTK